MRPQDAFKVILGAKRGSRIEVGGTIVRNHTCSGKKPGCPHRAGLEEHYFPSPCDQTCYEYPRNFNDSRWHLISFPE